MMCVCLMRFVVRMKAHRTNTRTHATTAKAIQRQGLAAVGFECLDSGLI
jgi:hypothetical protein